MKIYKTYKLNSLKFYVIKFYLYELMMFLSFLKNLVEFLTFYVRWICFQDAHEFIDVEKVRNKTMKMESIVLLFGWNFGFLFTS